MKEAKKKDRCRKLVWFVVGSVLTVAGFLVIPYLIQKYGNKIYKKSLNIDDIDCDEMGPEIVPFEVETKENE